MRDRVCVCVPSSERHAARDNRKDAARDSSEEGAPGGGDQYRLEIGKQHSLQGAPGRGPDKGGDAAEAEEEELARLASRS